MYFGDGMRHNVTNISCIEQSETYFTKHNKTYNLGDH